MNYTVVQVFKSLTIQQIVLFLLVTPIQFGTAGSFYKSSWSGLKRKTLGMDFLIVMGTSAAYFYSLVDVIISCTRSDHMARPHFDTSVMLFTFMILGATPP